MKFQNKMLVNAYEKSIGHRFTHSPSNLRYTDEEGCTDYDYHAMEWLRQNGILIQETGHKPRRAFVYKIKD